MKRVASLLLSLVLIFGSGSFLEARAANPIARPTTSSMEIDGLIYFFDAYNINDFNYFKLRDLAYVLTGTYKPFSVGWDDSTGTITLSKSEEYVPTGGELELNFFPTDKEAKPTSHKLLIDGAFVTCVAYNIDGLNYFKLRDIGENIDFSIAWDESANSITIDTYYGYYDQVDNPDEPVVTLSPTPAVSPDLTPTPSISVTPSPSISITPTPSISVTPSPSISVTPSPSITVTPEPEPSDSPTPLPTPSDSPVPSPTNSPSPSPSPTNSPSPSPSPSPTNSPSPIPSKTLAGIALGASVSDVDSILGSPYKSISGSLEYRFYGSNNQFAMVGVSGGVVEYVYSNYGFTDEATKFTDGNAGGVTYACDIGTRKSESDVSIVENIIFETSNAFRGFNSMSAFAFNDALQRAARLHSEDQVAQNYFSHTSLDGRTFTERAAEQGYTQWWGIAENIALQGSAVGVSFVNSWVNSSGHRQNILGDYNDFGVGFAIGSSCISTQMFARSR